jgi:HK97 family phage major capsid protein
MKLTDALKKWLCESKGLSAEASEDDFRKAAAEALADNSLDHDTFVKLTKDPDADKANAFSQQLDTVLDAVKSQQEVQTAQADQILKLVESVSKLTDNPTPTPEPEPAKKADIPKLPKMDLTGEPAETDPDKTVVDVITAEKQYDNSRTAKFFPGEDRRGRVHSRAGKRFAVGDENAIYMDSPSELDQAVKGSWFKYLLFKDPSTRRFSQFNDHDRQLVDYALHNCKFCGDDGDFGGPVVYNRKLTPSEIKSLGDEATSGGSSIVPNIFDADIITPAILHGELFPHVKLVNLTKGRIVDSGVVGNLTLTTSSTGQEVGAVDETITLSALASFITAFQTTIHVVHASCEIDLDFLNDTPINIANVITEQYGERLLEWLDTQIAAGDGTTEPDGCFNHAASTAITKAGGAGAAATVGDYESLMFTVTKPYRAGDRNRIGYCSTETTYQRARAIAVGAADQRRVFGMTHEDYMLLGHPYWINEGFTDNTEIFFANLARYRMYRRMGLTVQSSMEGRTLMRTNRMLIVVRARFGGQLETGVAASYSTQFAA